MKFKTNKIGLIAFVAMLVWQCSSNSLDVDVSEVDVSIEVDRMEQEVFDTTATTDYSQKNKELYEKYGLLYKLFFERMLREGSVEDPMAGVYLKRFVTNKDMQNIASDIDAKFHDFSSYQSKFEEAFKHYKYYFPDSSAPKIVTFYSNFNANVLPIEDQLCIGLDMYLGTEHELVKMLPAESIPQYLKDKMEDKYLVADAMKFFLLERFTNNEARQLDFLETIIELGKVMYLLDAMMPNESDAIKMAYTEEELTWCEENEENIWQTVVDQDLLYTKDQLKINQFIIDGPFTKGMPKESPSRVGVWLGWQMVRDYISETGKSVQELIQEKNPKNILNYYKPNE